MVFLLSYPTVTLVSVNGKPDEFLKKYVPKDWESSNTNLDRQERLLGDGLVGNMVAFINKDPSTSRFSYIAYL